MKIHIVDYGTGNVNSIANMLTWLGIDCAIIQKPSLVKNADKIILPGVGSFDNGMQLLHDGNWIDELTEFALIKRRYTLGICLGMQIMCNSSEEGIKNGLSWIDASVLRFNNKNNGIKVPHMGWNRLRLNFQSPLFSKTDLDYKFYFVHSFYVRLNDTKYETSSVDYGINFTSSFQHDNLLGVQFHPEKSHKFGKQLFSDFARL